MSVTNPSHTPLKTFGRTHRDEPFYGQYPIRLFPHRGTIRADDLAEWCGLRYLSSKSRTGKAYYRIATYRHQDGHRYVDRVYLGSLSDEDRVELALKFGDFGDQKIVRDGRLQRPRLTTEEREERDAIIASFYEQIANRRLKEKLEAEARGEASGR